MRRYTILERQPKTISLIIKYCQKLMLLSAYCFFLFYGGEGKRGEVSPDNESRPCIKERVFLKEIKCLVTNIEFFILLTNFFSVTGIFMKTQYEIITVLSSARMRSYPKSQKGMV